MNRKDVREFLKKRSTIWTLSLCMTGALVLGGIASMDQARRKAERTETESELGAQAQLDVNDTLGSSLDEEEAESNPVAAVAGNEVTEEKVTEAELETEKAEAANATVPSEAGDGAGQSDDIAQADGTGDAEADAQQVSASVISNEALVQNGIAFAADEEQLLWPAAGTLLMDYSMDGSVYFATLNQYKYNPALVLGSEVGNQVLAAAKGIVESIYIDEETGTTLVLNIGNGYRLTYGQLKELAVSQGDIVESGAVLGYVSEPTKYYTKEGSNLYFEMTKDETPVDPILYLE
ncbi:MAG: M23 family metallopeptidase [Lachnospiraceae bacterium]|nr:M23 family metallopeptidase [Lachnospiraceae bacterium]